MHRLGAKRIIRTSDYTKPKVEKAEIEDLLRNTLINVAKDYLNWDISEAASDASEQPIVDVFKREIGSDFSKYKLAKSFLRWSRDHSATNLSKDEIENCSALINSINLALK
ncbi:hypothetical protein [Symbiopectobacterium purcellii]|uniref:Uncharacterized protein n=1 Tax=Symbiopectobacterium purcellii TaxID=2871826 RepID=A0ABX9AQA8_9ENTR|nr:hypothetical protein [Symbiopectobacterium purcellii]QZN96809.1 hypothetical protein K6K13_05190 [Symbiopectobacterium purcellii]